MRRVSQTIAAALVLCGISMVAHANTSLYICNNHSDTLYVTSASIGSSRGLTRGNGWLAAGASRCTWARVAHDQTTIAFAFGLLDAAGRIVPVEVTPPSSFGQIDNTVGALCGPRSPAPIETSGLPPASTQGCAAEEISVPTSFHVRTGRTDWDEFLDVNISVSLGGRSYDLSAPDVDFEQIERDRFAIHETWRGYVAACQAALMADTSEPLSAEAAGTACACQSLVYDYVLSDTELTFSDLDFEYPHPWADTVRRRDLIDVRSPLRQCVAPNPNSSLDLSRFADPNLISERWTYLRN